MIAFMLHSDDGSIIALIITSGTKARFMVHCALKQVFMEISNIVLYYCCFLFSILHRANSAAAVLLSIALRQ